MVPGLSPRDQGGPTARAARHVPAGEIDLQEVAPPEILDPRRVEGTFGRLGGHSRGGALELVREDGAAGRDGSRHRLVRLLARVAAP